MGGVIAPLLAARTPDIAFVITMAGPAMTLGEAIVERECQALEKSGASGDAIARHGQFARALFAELRERADSEPVDAAWIAALATRFGASGTAAAASSDVWIRQFNLPWMRHAFRLEPVDALRRIRMPFLAINGSVDVQTVAKSNLALMSDVLKASGHGDFQVVELPGLNHLFQTCSTATSTSTRRLRRPSRRSRSGPSEPGSTRDFLPDRNELARQDAAPARSGATTQAATASRSLTCTRGPCSRA